MRRRFERVRSVQQRLAPKVRRWKKKAKSLFLEAAPEDVLQKARQAEASMHVYAWLNSSGLQPPK
jgi:hypothetical protein